MSVPFLSIYLQDTLTLKEVPDSLGEALPCLHGTGELAKLICPFLPSHPTFSLLPSSHKYCLEEETATAWLPKAPQFTGDLAVVLPASGGELWHTSLWFSSLQEKLFHSLGFYAKENKNQAEDT